MALSDFFRINMPYGIQKNDVGGWAAFNREFKPLGWNTDDRIEYKDLPIYTKYKGLTEKKLTELAHGEHGIERNENGEIVKIFFYNDVTNPQSHPKYWDNYFEKIKFLSKFERIY